MAAKEFVDFAAIREELSIEDIANYLGLRLTKGDQAKADCPACDSKNALAINKTKGKFFCHSKETGGDCIGLVAHINGIRQLDAAKLIQRDLMENGTVHGTSNSTNNGTDRSRRRERQEERQVRQSESPPAGMEPLDYLDPEHEDVEALGMTVEDATILGVGFANKGVLRGLVAVPLRTAEGTLVGYAGIADGRIGKLHIPKQNVVPLRRRAS